MVVLSSIQYLVMYQVAVAAAVVVAAVEFDDTSCLDLVAYRSTVAVCMFVALVCSSRALGNIVVY